MMRTRNRVVGGIGAAMLLTFAVPAIATPIASAAPRIDRETVEGVTTVEAALKNVAPTPPLTGATDADSASVVTIDGLTVDIPSDSTAPVTVEGNGTPQVSIVPPKEYGRSQQTSSGLVLASGADGSLGIQPHDNGVKMLTVLDGPHANHQFRFGVNVAGGGHIALGADGKVNVVAGDGGAFGSFDVPWAFDANGRPVPTHYQVEGADLVQVVEPASNAAYPIVADPDYHTNCGITGCSRYYTNLFSIRLFDNYQSKISAGYNMQTAICAIGFLGGPIGSVYAIMCGLGWQWLNYQFVDAITDAKTRGGCAVNRYWRSSPLGASDPYDWDYVGINNSYCYKS